VKRVRCRQQKPPVRHAVVTLVRLVAIVSEQLGFISSAFKVIETQRPKLACCWCDHIVQTSMPSKLAERSYAGPGLLAHIVTVKFAEHTPSLPPVGNIPPTGCGAESRQAGVLVRCGERTAGASLGPAVPVCADAGKVHTDDIPVLVQEPGSGKNRTDRLWMYVHDYRNAGSSQPPEV
jgi:transposase